MSVRRHAREALFVCGSLVVVFNILGWSLNLQALIRFPDAAMVPSTAVSIALLFIGSAAVLSRPAKKAAAKICSLMAAAIALINISLRKSSLPDLDHLVSNVMADDQMSEGTILCILVCAATILSLASEKLRKFELHLSGAIAGVLLIIAVFILCRFVPGTSACPLIFQKMSFYTAVCFLVLFINLFVAAVVLPFQQHEDSGT
ncbi:hypothetical protein ABEB22_00305 [Thioclava sp. 'Guangxiensis']|uniref:hypothetical protein n=1 Tax=Thioclava sp. 'Guangxiensis' TaxID=3149044 RepID=UPI0038781E2E